MMSPRHRHELSILWKLSLISRQVEGTHMRYERRCDILIFVIALDSKVKVHEIFFLDLCQTAKSRSRFLVPLTIDQIRRTHAEWTNVFVIETRSVRPDEKHINLSVPSSNPSHKNLFSSLYLLSCRNFRQLDFTIRMILTIHRVWQSLWLQLSPFRQTSRVKKHHIFSASALSLLL